ncbi:MAG: 3-deoxy-manno-octulosonate cytidylyltransferase [Candidatus Omnitrophica bacterium]|nr:3-deoxy-manno-octulosonate cytidylyltransferase [Candidatus Omnitrophota bacterium]MBU1871663.1 3-deoxy-manno-octulosonate cytidylyltransferase [Candidatus Omnitrophota bacterium]
MEVIGVIPARYSSTRFAGKVLADINGKPMIQHVWERAKKALLLDEVIIACDEEEVLNVGREFGANCLMTAKGHLSGSDRITEIVGSLDVKIIVNIQADEPLIQPLMIDSLVDALQSDDSVNMATIMKRIEHPEEVKNPNIVKVITDKDNFALYFSRAPIPFRAKNSEIEPVYYKHVGLYAYTKDFLFTYKNIPPSALEAAEKLEQLRVLEGGLRIKVIETKFETIGVDTPEDLERVRQILREEAGE